MTDSVGWKEFATRIDRGTGILRRMLVAIPCGSPVPV